MRGTWKLVLGKADATLTVTLFERLPRSRQAEVAAEGLRLLDFAAADIEKRELVWA